MLALMAGLNLSTVVALLGKARFYHFTALYATETHFICNTGKSLTTHNSRTMEFDQSYMTGSKVSTNEKLI